MSIGQTLTARHTQTGTSTMTTNGVKTGPTTRAVTLDRKLTFAGIEAVSVPAGTFNACKFLDSLGGTTWYAVGTGVRVRMAGGGTDYQATEAPMNGKPIKR